MTTDDPRTIAEAHAPAEARGAECKRCPLYGCGEGPVMGIIKPNSRLVVIAEAPGQNEVERGEPLVGASGKFMNAALANGGLQREEASLTNTTLCRPPGDQAFEEYLERLRAEALRNGTDAVLPTDCCFPRLRRDLDEANATVEYAMGKQALRALGKYHELPVGGAVKVDAGQVRLAELRKQHGAPVVLRDHTHPDGPKVLLTSYHPAYGFRGARAWLPVIGKVITRAARIASRAGQLDWVEPDYALDPTIDDIEDFARRAVAGNHRVMIDIETGPSAEGGGDGTFAQRCVLRTVGWGIWHYRGPGQGLGGGDFDYEVMQVPVHDMAGAPVWNALDQARVDAAVRLVCDHCELAFQNGSFDTGVLLRLGLMSDRRKRWMDTMIAHHDTDSNDLPHDLGFIIAEEFDAPRHKDDADHKSVDNVDYPRLKLYGAKDVYSQMRCAESLTQRVADLGTWAQFRTDTKLAPVARDMGGLGLIVIEPRRQELATTIQERIEFHRAEVRYQMALLDMERDRDLHEADTARRAVAAVLDGDNTAATKRAKVFRLYTDIAERRGLDHINPRAPMQMRDWFFVKHGLPPQLNTDGFEYDEDNYDDPSTGVAALLKLAEKYAHVGPVVDSILEYRSYDKLYSTYIADHRGLIQTMDWAAMGLPHRPDLRVLYINYKIHVVPTGRWSSSPNAQNIPALGKANMRSMFGSPPGHCIVGADFDQVELRLYAIQAQDKLLLEAFARGLDPHSLNAASLLVDDESQIWDMYNRIVNAPPKLKKYWRTVAKRFAFLEIYGGQAKTLFATMSASRNKMTGKRDFPNLQLDEVLVWHERWHRLHPETKRWQEACINIVGSEQFVAVPILDRRRRYFRGGLDSDNMAANMTIQGQAGSIANKCALELDEAIPHRGWSPMSGLYGQVHDWLGAYVPRARAVEACNIFTEVMTTRIRGVDITATPVISRLWSDQG